MRSLIHVVLPLDSSPPSQPQTVCKLYFDTWNGGRGESWTREKVRGATVHKARSKTPVAMSCYRSIFLWRHFALVSIWLISPWVSLILDYEIKQYPGSDKKEGIVWSLRTLSTFDKIRVCPCSFILEGYLDTKVSITMQCKGLTKRHKAYLK